MITFHNGFHELFCLKLLFLVNAKKVIDFKLTSLQDVTNEAKMQVTLATITYAN